MRRESDNLNNNSSNTPHSAYTASNVSGDNNLTHLNYPHPVHGYTSAGFSGYQPSKRNVENEGLISNVKLHKPPGFWIGDA